MNSKDLKYYILTVDENSIRANHVRNQLNDYDFEFVLYPMFTTYLV